MWRCQEIEISETIAALARARLIRKLESLVDLGAEERAFLAELPLRFESQPDNHDIVREGDKPSECCLIVDGFVCRYKILGDGQRQIFSFHISGDLPDLQGLHLEVMDHSLTTLSPSTLAFIPHSIMHDLMRRYPTIQTAFWRDTLIDAAVFREWLAGVGRRTAHQRIAHVICEVFLRAQSVGLVEEAGFAMPVTQAELGDSLGLSTVHVNRVLQDLRNQGMIQWRKQMIQVLDWRRLQAAGDFSSDYLHLKSLSTA